ncbi:hypothetical protein EL84_24215 [Paenibacillus sp. VT-400]|uniref:hypothetical protein n=1 Tax=Paenibacillus sp. VT-400 TaxID=1495853 RepID=UPI00064996DB|nr:hypothetical protein [Paenibacillus sp. VT-400]KLU55175.1 hypothetical protein EL84_24215 [Paenibacillus sp. VT-400]
MKKSMYILVVIMVLIMSACGGGSFKPDEFSKDDMAIIKIETDEKVKCGMSRLEAEKILGKGEGTTGIVSTLEYASGILIEYREDVVASIKLNGESKGNYKTARGAEVGILKGEVLEKYGHKFVITENSSAIEMKYILNNGEELSESEIEDKKYGLEKSYNASFYFDTSGYADSIILTNI